MMSDLTVVIVDGSDVIERPMTDAEIEQFKKDKKQADDLFKELSAKEAEAQLKRDAAKAKLAVLGLTIEDLKALGL